MRDSMYESSADRLQGVIGACRTLHQNPTPFARQAVVSAFNDAVQHSNFGQKKTPGWGPAGRFACA